jgi:hypothetical protein
MWIKEQENITCPVYSPCPGDFGMPIGQKSGKTEIGDWWGCREEFAFVYLKLKRYFFNIEGADGLSIGLFFTKVEDILGLSENQRSRIGPTSRPNIIWVEPRNWWRKCHMRRSLFTALLRQSVVYNRVHENFEAALYEGQYTYETRKALAHFLSGHTYYWGNIRGWVEAFSTIRYGRYPDPVQLLRNTPRPPDVPKIKTREVLLDT